MKLDVRRWNLGSVVVLAAGCGPVVSPGDDPSGGSTGTTGDGGPITITITQTSSPDTSVPECSDDLDCPYGYVCDGGVCGPGYYCSTCCGDDCGTYESDTDTDGDSCRYDSDCPNDGQCFEYMCLDGELLPACASGLVVESLPIPSVEGGVRLVFVDLGPETADVLVVGDGLGVQRIASDGTPTPIDTSALESPSLLGAGDFDGDGDEELAVYGVAADNEVVATFALDEQGATLLGTTPIVGFDPERFADVDGDGRADAVGWVPGEGLGIAPSLGDGTFDAPIVTPKIGPAMGTGPLDDDGRADVVTGSRTLGRGTADFQLELVAQLATAHPYTPPRTGLIEDFDLDGVGEVVTAVGGDDDDPGMLIERADAMGNLVASYLLPDAKWIYGTASMSSTGARDLVLDTAIVVGLPDAPCVASFDPQYGPGFEPSFRRLAMGDFDGDGNDDIVIWRQLSQAFYIVRSGG